MTVQRKFYSSITEYRWQGGATCGDIIEKEVILMLAFNEKSDPRHGEAGEGSFLKTSCTNINPCYSHLICHKSGLPANPPRPVSHSPWECSGSRSASESSQRYPTGRRPPRSCRTKQKTFKRDVQGLGMRMSEVETLTVILSPHLQQTETTIHVNPKLRWNQTKKCLSHAWDIASSMDFIVILLANTMQQKLGDLEMQTLSVEEVASSKSYVNLKSPPIFCAFLTDFRGLMMQIQMETTETSF